jgi:hypothetical protein
MVSHEPIASAPRRASATTRRPSTRHAIVTVALASFALGAGCERTPPRPPRPAPVDPARSGPPRGFGVLPPHVLQQVEALTDAGEIPSGILPGPLGQCVRRGAEALSPELASALRSLAYDSFAEDGCRLALAPAARDPALCDPIELPQLQRSCRARVAIARAERALCPRAIDEPGPDPMCVALASRNASACPGAGATTAEWCRAIAEHDRGRCRALPSPLRRRCDEDVRALEALTERSVRPQPAPGHMQLTIEWTDLSEPPRTLEADGFDRGALVSDSRAIYLVDPRRRWPSPTAYALDGRSAAVGFELSLSEQRRGKALRMRVVLPDGRSIDGPDGRPAGTVQYARASREVGHELSGEISAAGLCAGRPVRVRATFSTFVRDVVSDREARDGAPVASERDAGAEE